MNSFTVLLLASAVSICAAAGSGNTDPLNAKSVYDFTALDIDEQTTVDLNSAEFKGHPLLIVNVATYCVKTDSTYTWMKNLADKYHDTKGLRILLFPCNQFLSQEPDSNEDIAKFARGYSDKFNLFAKIDVNGANAHPLYQYLKQQQKGSLGFFSGGAIEWNFAKFLVDKNGAVVERWNPFTSTATVEKDMLKYL